MTSETIQTIDNTERDKFDAIASGWWDPEGPFRPLHELNPARLKFIADRASLSGAQVLDVGCGGGILAESLARKGGHVTAIDVAPRVLATARLHLHESGLEVDYREKTVEDQAQDSPRAFDVVTCMEMLEHVPDPASIIQSIQELLKPGGHLFLTTSFNLYPHESHLKKNTKYAGKEIELMKKFGFTPVSFPSPIPLLAKSQLFRKET